MMKQENARDMEIFDPVLTMIEAYNKANKLEKELADLKQQNVLSEIPCSWR